MDDLSITSVYLISISLWIVSIAVSSGSPAFSSTSLTWCYLFYSYIVFFMFSSVQFSSVAQSCLTLWNPMNHSTAGLPLYHHLPEFTQTHVHRVGDAIQPSHPLSSPSPPAPNPSQHQSLFQRVNINFGLFYIFHYSVLKPLYACSIICVISGSISIDFSFSWCGSYFLASLYGW